MEEMTDYVHLVQYYETDRMGITHHSNYIRWMEEARVHFLSAIGWDYAKLEAMGIVSPVISLTCEYRHPTTFSDRVSIRVEVMEVGGVTLRLRYTMRNQDGTEVCTGTSSHAFLNAEGRPVRMKRDYPDFYETLSRLAGGKAAPENG